MQGGVFKSKGKKKPCRLYETSPTYECGEPYTVPLDGNRFYQGTRVVELYLAVDSHLKHVFHKIN
jgi:hypothetical protein